MRTTEPTQIEKGERSEWTREFCGYSPSEYTLQYRFRGDGPGINVNATADGDKFYAVISSTDSVTLSATSYKWQAWMTEIADTDNKICVGSGFTSVIEGFSEDNVDPVDLRSPAKIMLDAIDAALLAFASDDVLEYEIETPAGRRKIKRSDKTTLSSERKYWAGIVTNEKAREDAKNGKPLMKSIKMVVYDE